MRVFWSVVPSCLFKRHIRVYVNRRQDSFILAQASTLFMNHDIPLLPHLIVNNLGNPDEQMNERKKTKNSQRKFISLGSLHVNTELWTVNGIHQLKIVVCNACASLSLSLFDRMGLVCCSNCYLHCEIFETQHKINAPRSCLI